MGSGVPKSEESFHPEAGNPALKRRGFSKTGWEGFEAPPKPTQSQALRPGFSRS